VSDSRDGVERVLRYAVLELTNRCNLRCAHCSSSSGQARPQELSCEQWQQVIADLTVLGCEEITMLGGEVFLNPDWLALARQVRDAGIRLSIITNGLLINDGRLAELRSLELETLGLSFDGASPAGYQAVRGVDGFGQIWDLARRIRDGGQVELNLITTFSRLNLAELEPLIDLLDGEQINWQVQFASTGSRRFDRQLFVSPQQYGQVCFRIGEIMLAAKQDNWISTMDDFGYFPIDPRHRLLHFHWPGCQAGISVIGIRANGDVLGCLSLGDAFVEANLRDRPLADLWAAPDAFERFRHKTARQLQGGCQHCPMAEGCLAGCAAMAVSSTGSLYDNRHCLRRIETDELLAELDQG
jgi:radical SAM protein with 4Fe4S-binding SPASM domain